MKEPASSYLSTHISLKKLKAPEQHNDRLLSYAQLINFLLSIYATVDDFACAEKYLESYIQAQWMAPVKSAKKIYTKTLWCGLLYIEKRVKSKLVEEFEKAICDNIYLYCRRNPFDT